MKKGIVKVSDLWCETVFSFRKWKQQNDFRSFVPSSVNLSGLNSKWLSEFAGNQKLIDFHHLLFLLKFSSRKQKKKGSLNWVTSSVQAKKLSLLIRLLKYNFYNNFIIPVYS
jgi:hypothetical protein